MNKCIQCKEETKNPKFCSRSCATKHRNEKRGEGKEKFCKNCGKELTGEKRTHKCCSRECGSEYRKKETIKKWIKGDISGVTKSGKFLSETIRKYLIEKENYKCSKCGWGEINKKTGKSPLQINHIDGNYRNNSFTNLEVLCPNCHSLTDTFGGLNKGNGRDYRY